MTEQETGVEREDASEFACDCFVEGLVGGGEVTAVEPPDTRGTVCEGEDAGEWWAPWVKLDGKPDLDDGREEFEEVVGDGVVRGWMWVNGVTPGDAGCDGAASHAPGTGVGEKEVCGAACGQEVDTGAIPCTGQVEEPEV